jgi:hypothetical protein
MDEFRYPLLIMNSCMPSHLEDGSVYLTYRQEVRAMGLKLVGEDGSSFADDFQWSCMDYTHLPLSGNIL